MGQFSNLIKYADNNVLEDIKDSDSISVKMNKSLKWYRKFVREASLKDNIGPLKYLGDNIPHQVSNPKQIQIGQILFYTYDPKTKDEMEYYDTCPMVILFDIKPDTFFGLNVHYLHPDVRHKLMTDLKKTASNKSLKDGTKMRINWQILNSAVRNNIWVKNSVKQYLFKQIKSNVLIVPSSQWQFATWLPLERFKKASNAHVWSDSNSR